MPTHTCKSGASPADGTTCGTGKACKGGACVDASCGDMVVTSGEECDDGNLMNGDGCDACKFSCVSTDSARNCTPADSCAGPVHRRHGGGVQGGRVHGESDAHAAFPKSDPAHPFDLIATLYHAVGIDPARSFLDAMSRPRRLVDHGSPILSLF